MAAPSSAQYNLYNYNYNYNATRQPAAQAKPKPQPQYRRHHDFDTWRDKCCCCGCVILLLAMISGLILLLLLQPINLPSFSLQSFHLTSSGIRVRNSTLNAGFNYTITAVNRNGRMGVKYHSVDVEVWYHGLVVGRSSIPSLYQGHWSNTSMSSQLFVQDFALSATSAASLANHIQDNLVPLHIRADAKVHLKLFKSTSPAFWMRAQCKVVLSVSPATLISKSCVFRRSTRKIS